MAKSVAPASFVQPVPLQFSLFTSSQSTISLLQSEHQRPRKLCCRKRPRTLRCTLYPSPSQERPFEPPPLFTTGEILHARYRVQAPLGGGGQAATWSAIDEHARLIEDENVVLKVLSLRGMGAWKALELLKREARVLQSIRHEGIPRYVDYFETDRGADRVFVLVQKRAQGRTLREWVESGWRFGRGGIDAVLKGLLEILDYIHGLSPVVVHRDVKPENVVIQLEDDGTVSKVSLVDFGGVSGGRFSKSWGDVASTVVGTFGYMAPEQVRGIVDTRSDLYGAGATILYMLTGRMPGELPHNKLRIDLEKVFGPEERRRLDRVYSVVKRLLEPALEDRISSAHLALDLLNGEATFPMDVDPEGEEVLEVVENVKRGLLSWGSAGTKVIRKPADTKAIVRREHDGQVLRVEIPRPGMNADVLSTGAFALAWYGFLSFWVVGALTGGGSILTSLFSLPFWIGGSQIVRRAADEYGSRTLVLLEKRGENYLNGGINQFQITIDTPLNGQENIIGDMRDIVDVSVECITLSAGKAHYALQLREGSRLHQFGEFLKYDEQQYIAAAMKDFLKR